MQQLKETWQCGANFDAQSNSPCVTVAVDMNRSCQVVVPILSRNDPIDLDHNFPVGPSLSRNDPLDLDAIFQTTEFPKHFNCNFPNI